MIEYKRLTLAELPSLLRLYPQLSGGAPLPDKEKAQAVWEESARLGVEYFGALDGGAVVSVCHLCLIPNLTHEGRPVGFIENVVTDSLYRRRGIGAKVVSAAVARAREAGCYKVLLQSGWQRREAHAFYESIGFDGDSKRAFEIRFD